MKTHCKNGHELTTENTYVSPSGVRACRKCRCNHAASSHKKNPDLQRKHGREWIARQRAMHPEKFKAYNLKSDYDMSLDTYNAMLKEQGGCCAICNRVMDNPHVDHDHETNKIRQLLCRECNSALGFLREDVAVVERLLAYLKKWKEQ